MRRMAFPANIQDMIDDFAFLDDWEDRYMHVIDLGKGLPPLPAGSQTDANKVKGCASQVWLISEKADDIWTFSGDSDAHIVKGLVAIVLEIFSGRSAAEIASLDANEILSKLGLAEHLSAQRSNGLAAMIGRIKTEAKA
jgi:cysteine desulfuration protein SufE